MEKFTPEQLEAIEAVLRDFHQVPDGPNFKIAEEKADTILAALTRPKPEFAIGQLLAHQRNDFECLRVSANDGMKYLNYRPLTQQEVGPDWVPKEPVKALRAWVDWVAAQGSLLERQRAPYEDVLRAAPLRLAAFDAAMGDES